MDNTIDPISPPTPRPCHITSAKTLLSRKTSTGDKYLPLERKLTRCAVLSSIDTTKPTDQWAIDNVSTIENMVLGHVPDLITRFDSGWIVAVHAQEYLRNLKEKPPATMPKMVLAAKKHLLKLGVAPAPSAALMEAPGAQIVSDAMAVSSGSGEGFAQSTVPYATGNEHVEDGTRRNGRHAPYQNARRGVHSAPMPRGSIRRQLPVRGASDGGAMRSSTARGQDFLGPERHSSPEPFAPSAPAGSYGFEGTPGYYSENAYPDAAGRMEGVYMPDIQRPSDVANGTDDRQSSVSDVLSGVAKLQMDYSDYSAAVVQSLVQASNQPFDMNCIDPVLRAQEGTEASGRKG